MPAAVIWAVSTIGTLASSAFLVMYAVQIGTALTVLGGLAYSSAKSKKTKQKSKDAYNAAQVDRLVNITSSTAPRDLVLGRARKGGTYMYKASTGTHQQDLYLAIALAGHEIDAVEQIYLDDVAVTIDGSGYVLNAPWNTTSTPTAKIGTGAGYTATLPSNYVPGSLSATYPVTREYSSGGTQIGADPCSVWVVGLTAYTSKPNATISYQYTVVSSNVQIAIHLGQPGQTADPWLMAAFGSAWPSTNVAQGVAYLVARLRYSETSFPSGVPNITALIRGAKVYDPRTGVTAWSDNPALLARHVYQHPDFGKATITATEDARFAASANSCDISTVYTVDGVAQTARPLYRAGIVAECGTEPKSVLDDLYQAMGGSWAFSGGEFFSQVGVYTAPVMHLTDADLAVIQRNGASETQSPISISVHKQRADQFNTVTPTIWDEEQDYKETPLSSLVATTLLARDGVSLVEDVSMPAVSYAPQALHIAGITIRDARDPLVVSLPFKLRAYPLELFDNVTLTLSRYGWSNKVFQILERSWNVDATLQLKLKETSAAITQMDAGFSAQGFAKNTNLPKPWEVTSVGDLTITSGTAELVVQLDGTVQSRMRISWPQVDDAAVQQSGQIEVQYRRGDSDGAWASLVVPGNETQVVTADVQDGEAYIIRARAKTKVAVSDWNLQKQHQVIGKTEPPSPFDIFTVLAQPDGTRQYNFGYAGRADVDWLGAEIRYTSGTTATPDWDTMTLLQNESTYYTSSPVEINAPLAGEYTFACKSIDTTGNKSTYKVVNITLPARRLGSVFDEFFEHTDGWLGTKTGCHIEDGALLADDSTTWDTLPSTWDAWLYWIMSPTSPIVYTSPVHDFGTVIAGQVDSAIDAEGTVTQELSTSADGTTWSTWGDASAAFSSRYIKLRLTVAATVPAPVPAVREWSYQIIAPMKNEYLNDIDISTLTGAYRIGVGDIRIPLAGSYTVIKRTSVVIQDSSGGTWACTRIDQSLSPAPRWQFRLNGVLADPALVDFFIEGY